MRARKQILRRRAKARRLRDEENLSVRQIAERLGVSPATVHADLKADEPERPLPPPPKGNQRARTHGAYSAVALTPLRAVYEQQARQRWPHLESHQIELWARQAARVHQLADHEGAHGALLDEATGKVRDASNRLAKWEARLEKITAEYDEQARDLAGRCSGGGGAVVQHDPATRPLVARLAGRPLDDVLADAALAADARALAAGAPRSHPAAPAGSFDVTPATEEPR